MKRLFAVSALIAATACGGDEPRAAADRDASASKVARPHGAGGAADLTYDLAECKHAPRASIYDRMGEMWRAEQYGDHSLSLTVWRLDSGSDEFSLHASENGAERQINTVQGSATAGEGSIAITPVGEGIRFAIDGKDANGDAVSARVNCAKLVPLVAEGG